jgi:hypothetical protein
VIWDFGLEKDGSRVTGYELRGTGRELRDTGCKGLTIVSGRSNILGPPSADQFKIHHHKNDSANSARAGHKSSIFNLQSSIFFGFREQVLDLHFNIDGEILQPWKPF